MEDLKILTGKKVLIVDDETDVLESLVELLDMCQTETATDFESAQELLNKNTYDIAVLDIMGVQGFDLLKVANQRGVPALMFTAHALSPEAFDKSLEGGAKAYIPKEKMSEIASYVAELLTELQKGIEKPTNWFNRLKSFFSKQFGYDWQSKADEFREKYDHLDFDD